MIFERLIFRKHLEEGEKILYSVHKHWVVIFKPVIEIAFFGFLIPWGLYMAGFNKPVFFWMAVAWSVMAYFRFLYVFVDWYSNTWLITDMAIITIEWRGIFSNMATRVGYEDIEGVAYEIKGFWPTVLRYGDVILKVMSGNNLFLKSVRAPKRVELAIGRYQELFLHDKEMMDAKGLKALLSQIVVDNMRH
ncbi:hypothetical protein JXA05_04730 [Candidatus Peregrinibacteria bacterium]|nr:hypothetical protein [Candidatus Peregrinibacteria bacterium]